LANHLDSGPDPRWIKRRTGGDEGFEHHLRRRGRWQAKSSQSLQDGILG